MRTREYKPKRKLRGSKINEQPIAISKTNDEMKKGLGIPVNVYSLTISIPGWHYGAKFKNYTIDIVCVAVDHMPQPCPWPCLLLEPGLRPSGDFRTMRMLYSLEPGSHLSKWRKIRREGLMITQIWWARVHYKGSKVYVDRLWHPERGFSMAMFGLENVRAKDRIKEGRRALNGAALIEMDERRGRPPGSYKISSENFPQQVIKSYEEYKREYQERPSQKELAEVMFISESTLYRQLKRHHLPWPPVET